MNLLTTFTQSPSLKASQSRNSSDFLLAQITSLKVPSSNSLNGKRQVISKTEEDLNSTETTVSKKFKPNEGSPAVELTKSDVAIQKREIQYRQTKKKASKSQKNAILVEDEEDCLIIENPVVKNSGNTWVCEENSSLDKYFDSLLNPLNQQLDFKTENLVYEYPFTKDFEIVIVDDEYEDQLTCESTPVINEENLELQKQNSVESIESKKEVVQEGEKALISVGTDQYANIPSLNRKQNKIRNLKCIWEPNCCESESFERWSEGIEKIVGIQITNQEKVLKTLKNFDMDLKATLEAIKRNKAQYKDYFRIKRPINSKYWGVCEL